MSTSHPYRRNTIALAFCLFAMTTTVWPQSHGGLGVAIRAGGLIGDTELTDKPHGQAHLALRGALAGPLLWELGGGYARLDGTDYASNLAVGELRLLLAKRSGRLRPLLYAGAGAVRYNLAESPPGRTSDIEALGTAATVPVGLGLQFVRSDSRAIEILAGYTYTLKDDINGAIYEKGNDVHWGVTIGLTFGAFNPRDESPSPVLSTPPAAQPVPTPPTPEPPIQVVPELIVQEAPPLETEPEPDIESSPIEIAPSIVEAPPVVPIPAPELSFAPLYFARGSTRISANGLSLIAEIAKSVEHRNVVIVEARAYTDARGRNPHLARRRAEAVEQALLAQGIEQWRVQVRVRRDIQRPSSESWKARRVEIVPVK
ncbi:MAG: OmpA family protein [Gemmatimonadetes bacterium]|jgi:outer membrane protein OmpA-like peptidoglycan-associated protein|nr:OmpA family protein [Gemmatimonadota bacterium]MBT5146539.1 OmpA family protein [Gemmatimonadota bacterium]MBT5591460.1 OmpA family protein [Gemmatimonadota bacterium]MBT5962085.1 OmpA family protein [Gemmatimonadota bacterium]MBT7599372.1 OmpA family protein [Gemmatimonadota bacterium]